jgi:hypothetical protein
MSCNLLLLDEKRRLFALWNYDLSMTFNVLVLFCVLILSHKLVLFLSELVIELVKVVYMLLLVTFKFMLLESNIGVAAAVLACVKILAIFDFKFSGLDQ